MEQKAYTLQDRARGFGAFLYGHKAIAAIALLYLIAQGADTNMVSRGGPERAKKAAEDCAALLERCSLPNMEDIARLDQEFIQDNLSPGGCADLLAAAFFLQSWERAE